VRNRDTWVVTAIGHDGSITVTHQGGHGDVTLPVEYVHTHVRLGYAATEHGWQSDTVDTAIALASPATSRRGLYVAATRGSDVNTLCVITESDDIAEARDVLEAIIATDRADIAATTQRRALAASTPREATAVVSAPTPRCEIPDWFSIALADARRQLLDAQNSEAERSARRAEADAAVVTADTIAAGVAAATAPDRDALQNAEARAADARRRHTPQPTGSTPHRASNGAPSAMTSMLPSNNSNGPRPTSSAPGNEPPQRWHATQRPSRTRAQPDNTSTPSTAWTPHRQSSANTACTSAPCTPGSTGPKATKYPTARSAPRLPCSLTGGSPSDSWPSRSARISRPEQSNRALAASPWSTISMRTSRSGTLASNGEP
jgi:hypothetical protein